MYLWISVSYVGCIWAITEHVPFSLNTTASTQALFAWHPRPSACFYGEVVWWLSQSCECNTLIFGDCHSLVDVDGMNIQTWIDILDVSEGFGPLRQADPFSHLVYIILYAFRRAYSIKQVLSTWCLGSASYWPHMIKGIVIHVISISNQFVKISSLCILYSSRQRGIS